MTDQKSYFNYTTAAALIANKISDRGDFVVIQRTHQGEQPQVWSTGDKELTQQMLSQVSQLEPTS